MQPDADPAERLSASRAALAAGRLDDARAHCDGALTLAPGAADAWHQRGLIALAGGDIGQAEQALREALRLAPGSPPLLRTLALALLRAARFDDARTTLRQALAADPALAPSLTRLSDQLLGAGRPREAEAVVRATLPHTDGRRQVQALHQLAVCRMLLGDPAESERVNRRILHLAPDDAQAWNNLGNLLRSRFQLAAAEACFRRALAAGSAPLVHNNLGCALLDQGRADEAIAAYRDGLLAAPRDPATIHNLLLALHYSPSLSAQSIWDAHRAYGRDAAAEDAAAEPPQSPPAAPATVRHAGHGPGRPLRVGFVSADLCAHPVGRFLLPLIEALDPARVTTLAYSEGPAEDALTERLRGAFGHWRRIRGVSDTEAAALIRRDRVDLLFDLSGHTPGQRLDLFRLRPAPVAVTWLGYPDTTGLPWIDYRLTDAIADPPGHDARHTERLLRMPDGCHCYRPADGSPAPTLRRDPAPGAVTFGCFNALSKYNAPTLDTWAELLRRLPDAALLLKTSGLGCASVRRRILAHFDAAGVAPERVRILPRTADHDAHLALYQDVHIALDTTPYNGTTTTCDAYWMGVPVVTLAGDRCCARMGASLAARVGLDDLVAGDPAGYLDIATALAQDPARIRRLRGSLRGTLQRVPLGSPALFAARFADLLEDLAERHGRSSPR